MNLTRKLRVPPGKKFRLRSIDPGSTAGLRSKAASEPILERNLARIYELQYQLYAEHERSVLIVLQALDAAGKDGTIRRLSAGFNPQGCRVTSFKVPSTEEADHEFLWRIHQAVPRKGEIGIFNRSHYEDVLVVRVHDIVPKKVWTKRYSQINAFEEHLSNSGVCILKFFLYISKDEQKKRFQERLEDPRKHWKFSPADLEERKHWDDYIDAYQDALRMCSTPCAPWYVIPSNHNWYRNTVISQIVVDALEDMDPKLPAPKFDRTKIKIDG